MMNSAANGKASSCNKPKDLSEVCAANRIATGATTSAPAVSATPEAQIFTTKRRAFGRFAWRSGNCLSRKNNARNVAAIAAAMAASKVEIQSDTR